MEAPTSETASLPEAASDGEQSPAASGLHSSRSNVAGAGSEPGIQTPPSNGVVPTVTIEGIEPVVSGGDWQRICILLGPIEAAGQLSPAMSLVYALARCESTELGADKGILDLAIRSVGTLLGVDPKSATAVLLAKRLLRRGPLSWKRRPAPRATLSLVIMVVGLAIGAGTGWLLSSSLWRHLLHLLAR